MVQASLHRSAGILLHPTSLPGPFGIGDLGPTAYRWVETLAAMRQSWWQVLPLGPTGASDSPYQSFSAFAGNINLLSPELLEREGLVSSSFWAGQSFPDDRVDYDRVTPFKKSLLRAAWAKFRLHIIVFFIIVAESRFSLPEGSYGCPSHWEGGRP